MLRKILIVVTVLFACTQRSSAGPPHVYGEPGGGHIRVQTMGEDWSHPGIYWLPKGTKLEDFLKRAGVPKAPPPEGEFSDSVRVKRGGKYPIMFSLGNLELGEIKVSFVLNDGDIVDMQNAAL